VRYVDARKIILIAFITTLMTDVFAFSPAMAGGDRKKITAISAITVTAVTTRKVWKRN